MYLTQVYKITNHCGVHKIVISDTSVKKNYRRQWEFISVSIFLCEINNENFLVYFNLSRILLKINSDKLSVITI